MPRLKASLGDYAALIKPKLTVMALATTLLGFVMGEIGPADPLVLFLTLLGAFGVGGCANSLNQIIEREADGRMERTKGRPLPSGKLSPVQASVFAFFLGVMGLSVLYFGVNHETAFLGLVTILIYVVLYTPLKQKTALNTFVGAIPGALPVLMGWTASTGEFGLGGWSLFLVLFVWQLPHFFAIAWAYREDYLRGGFKMTASDDTVGDKVFFRTFFYCLALSIVSLFPTFVRITGYIYFWAALTLGILFAIFAFWTSRQRVKQVRLFIQGTILYLILIIIFMIIDKI